jgi:hypothetical protein
MISDAAKRHTHVRLTKHLAKLTASQCTAADTNCPRRSWRRSALRCGSIRQRQHLRSQVTLLSVNYL